MKLAEAVGNDPARIELTIANVPQLSTIRISHRVRDMAWSK